MLVDLINELSADFSTLIKDSLEISGSCLLTSIIRQCVKENGKRIICVNTEPNFTTPTYSLANVTVVDASQDYESILEKVISAAMDSNSCVIFTSLSLFLMNYSVCRFSKLLRSLHDADSISSVVGLIHTDVLVNEEALSITEYMFDAVINLLPVQDCLTNSYSGHVKCIRRKANGKLITSDEYFSLNPDYSLNEVHASTSAAIKSLVEVKTVDVTSGVTFNLSLSDKERDAKNKLQLPYLKKDSEKKTILSLSANSGSPLVKIGGSSDPSPAGGGKIYYHYDEADDFDEEDPDDDLDF